MTAPIPRRTQRSVIRMYFEAFSLDGISHHLGISKGSVVDIIRKLKTGRYEEFQDVHDIVDRLREVANFVRKEFGGDLERCHVGSVAWVALNKLGLDPAQVPEWAKMCHDFTPSDMSPQEFLEIALHAWRLRNSFGADLRELPNRIESLKAEIDSLGAKCASLDSEAEAKEASLAQLLEELGLSRDIHALRSTRAEEELRLGDVQARRKAALSAAQITDQGLEQFRVFADTTKAKGVPVDGPLLDTLLSLVASLGADGIRDVDRLRRLLLKEGMTAAVGAKLLTGLWRLGFTVDRAAEVARVLGVEEPFPQALKRFESLLLEFGSWPATVAASKRRAEELRRREDAQRAESETLDQNVKSKRKALEDLEGELRRATGNLERAKGEIIKAKAECETQLQKPREELHRIQALRDTPFRELADRLTMQDYNLLGIHMWKKEPVGPLPPAVEFIWRLMSG